MRIAIFNQKGGVGKTTTTLNIAGALARHGRRSLLIDLDPQAHLTSIRSNERAPVGASVFSLYQDNRPLAELLQPWPNIGWLVPAHGELIKVDSLFGKGPNILGRLRKGLDELESNEAAISNAAAYSLIDCCPFLGVLSLNAIFAADCIIVPVSSDYLSLKSAEQIDRTLCALEPVLKRKMARRYLLTRFDRRRRMSFEIADRLTQRFGDEVCSTHISENVAIAEAPSVNRDIFTHAPSSRGATDYLALLEELETSGFLKPAGC